MARLNEWIKFRKKLLRDPRVLIVSRICHTKRVTVFGALVTLWCLGDEYAEKNGHLPGYTPDDIDAECELPGFCRALPPDWMRLEGETIYLPNYQEHNGTTAKKRAEATSRQRCHRNVTDPSHKTCDKSVTRGRGRVRGRKSTPQPPSLPDELATPEFVDAWARWHQHRREIGQPLKPTTEAAQLKKLAAMGAARAVAAILHSIEHGWTGLYEPKGQPSVNGKHSRIDELFADLDVGDA